MIDTIMLLMGITGVLGLIFMRIRRPVETKQFFLDIALTLLNPWLKRRIRKRYKRVPRRSVAFPPELIQYYRRRSDSRREYMQLWVERFIDVCDSTGTRVPDDILPPHSPLRRTLRIYSDVYEVHEPQVTKRNGMGQINNVHPRFHPHPVTCPGYFNMDEVRDGGGVTVTTYASCSLCGWSINMSRAQVWELQNEASRRKMYQGPIDGIPGENTMRAIQKLNSYGFRAEDL